MAKAHHKQVKVGSAQPPFPGGWVSVLIKSAQSYSPDTKEWFGPEDRPRTLDRLMSEKKPVKEASFREWKSKLVSFVTRVFPNVASINDFAKLYVDEYFRLWSDCALAAPFLMPTPNKAAARRRTLHRALLRDLVLRVCYLESCERFLSGQLDVPLFPVKSFEGHYGMLISKSLPRGSDGEERLADDLKVSGRTLRRWREGTAVPSRKNLEDLTPEPSARLSCGIGFLDLLLRRLRLRRNPIAAELLCVGLCFMREHRLALAEFRGQIPAGGPGKEEQTEVEFGQFVRFGQNLLLHPGLERMDAAMPNNVWRAHLEALQYGRIFDLVEVYLSVDSEKSEDAFLRFLEPSLPSD